MELAEQKIIFIHIPKTAGKTVHSILERNFPRRQICTFSGRKTMAEIALLKKTSPSALERYRLFKGHIPYGIHHKLNCPYRYLTFLRHPVELAISSYCYIKNTPAHARYKDIVRSKDDVMSLEEFCECYDLNFFRNLHVRMLSSENGDFVKGQLTTDHLQKAIYRLEKCSFGVVEHFDASLLLIGRELALENLCYIKRNVTRNKKNSRCIAESTRSRIAECNALDMQLYAQASELFRQRLQQHGIGASEVARFRKENAAYQRYAGLYYWLEDVARNMVNTVIGIYKDRKSINDEK